MGGDHRWRSPSTAGEHKRALAASWDTKWRASLGTCWLRGKPLKGYSLGLDVCHQASSELLGVGVEAGVI